MNFPLILLLIAIITTISFKLDIIVHELGHALTGALFSKAEVTVYIGSFGDKNRAFGFKLGLLRFFIKYNPLLWRGGLCELSNTNISIRQGIIFIIMGPLLSIFCGLILVISSFCFDWHGATKFTGVIFFVVTIFSFFRELIPSNKGITTFDGLTIYNDGFQLKRLLAAKQLPSLAEHAVILYEEEKYVDAAKIFEKILKDFPEAAFFKMAISSNLMTKNYFSAKQVSDDFKSMFDFDADDYSNAGLIYSYLEIYDSAIEFYMQSLEINPAHIYSLNNLGFTLNIVREYEKALLLCDKSIELDPTFAFAYNNRGLAKVMLGNYADGLDDINHSIQLNNNNSYAYRNLGIYYSEIKKYEEAVEMFEKAKLMDDSTHQIEEYLEKARLTATI